MSMRRQHLLILGAVALGSAATFAFARGGPLRNDKPLATLKNVSATTTTTIHHVLTTGQSLAVGAEGAPPLSKEQPYANLSFSQGVLHANIGLESFAPLIERGSETMSSSLANSVTSLAPNNDYTMLVSIAAISGTPYGELKKGRAIYKTALDQVSAAKKLAPKTYAFEAIVNVHGEAEHSWKNPTYDRDLLEWQHDFETDIRELLGQPALSFPMLITQISSWPVYGDATSDIPRQQIEAHKTSNGKVVLVGPKYHLPYAADGVHLTNEGYRHMGEDYAKVYRRVVIEKAKWEPLRPLSIARQGKRIDITFAVPTKPLVLDTDLVQDPGSFGFEYVEDESGTNHIKSVKVSGPDRITIELAKEPGAAKNRRLRYAFTSTPGTSAGPRTGPRGNLRDSDSTPSRFGYPLHNWCVHFDESVP